MNSQNLIKSKQEELKALKLDNKWENIKNKLILQKIFLNLEINRTLLVVKYNKAIQKKINIDIDDFKQNSKIEINIKPVKNKFGKFINILEEENEKYFHIYFNDGKEEIQRKKITENDKVNEIKILIDKPIISFYKLFYDCQCIESIHFPKFYRNNIKLYVFSMLILKRIRLLKFYY